MSPRAFRALRWLNRSHGPALRLTFAGLMAVATFIITGRAALAREAAALCRGDRFATALHRLRWYLTHGWTARMMPGDVPLFDPTSDMDPGAVHALADWLAGRRGLHADLARLYVLARQIRDSRDPAEQQALMQRFETQASDLVRDMTYPDTRKQVAGKSAPQFTLDQARAALSAIQSCDLPFYVISGTFLGAVREGAFLAHDYDIDVGIDIADFDEARLRHQITAGPDLAYINASDHLDLTRDPDGLWIGQPLPALIRVMHASGIGIDIFVHHPDGDLCWHGSAKHRWDNSAFTLSDYALSGLSVRGPADADRYLTENYGDWRTPVTSFNCSTGTPNVSFPRNPSALAEQLRTALLPGRPADRQVAALILWQEGYLHRTGDRTTFRFGWA
ncbi:LicD family protein [Loktanella sp. DSM 29012]|uniref:LicD family protein n=1 Tax=Loktanella sp. DSM 29012 TaxID=1881056 RepID=UPI0008B3ADE9|nr:LicD family protein [Loktanella sp. DSM 29012]SEQ76757.1 LicD family protein [Loktanella sp. DSM 29012]